MMKRIKINSPAMWFSKGMMEMKRNKTAEEPKKQNAGARKRVALEEENRVKLDRWMTQPKHKVWTMFKNILMLMLSIHHVFHYSVIGSPCHQLTIMVHAIH